MTYVCIIFAHCFVAYFSVLLHIHLFLLILHPKKSPYLILFPELLSKNCPHNQPFCNKFPDSPQFYANFVCFWPSCTYMILLFFPPTGHLRATFLHPSAFSIYFPLVFLLAYSCLFQRCKFHNSLIYIQKLEIGVFFLRNENLEKWMAALYSWPPPGEVSSMRLLNGHSFAFFFVCCFLYFLTSQILASQILTSQFLASQIFFSVIAQGYPSTEVSRHLQVAKFLPFQLLHNGT